MSEVKYPCDLAVIVERELGQKGIQISEVTLSRIFEIIYFASLKTEELQQISCSLTYIDPDNPDPNPPERIVADRWSYVKFNDYLKLDIKNIVKLAKAANPYSTSIAIYNKDNNLRIWGLIDQAHKYNNFINYESDTGPERPGLLNVSITGIGDISVFSGYSLIARLRHSNIIQNYNNIFHVGPISEILNRYAYQYIERIRGAVGNIFNKRVHWRATLYMDWLNTIKRILLHIQGFKHGGALLIIPNDCTTDLNIKYDINYDRLYTLLHENHKNSILLCDVEDYIFENYMSKRKKSMPLDSHINADCRRNDVEDSNNGISGCVRFISSLSCVDGLVLMSRELKVSGFGVEIRSDAELNNVYIAANSLATSESLKKIDSEQYGTRHRSMMRYCSKHEGSIGFVISQDGDIRAITKVNDKLIIWENIMVQLELEE